MYHKHDYCTSQGTDHKTIPHNEQPNDLPTTSFNDCKNWKAILRHKKVHSILPTQGEYKGRHKVVQNRKWINHVNGLHWRGNWAGHPLLEKVVYGKGKENYIVCMYFFSQWQANTQVRNNMGTSLYDKLTAIKQTARQTVAAFRNKMTNHVSQTGRERTIIEMGQDGQTECIMGSKTAFVVMFITQTPLGFFLWNENRT